MVRRYDGRGSRIRDGYKPNGDVKCEECFTKKLELDRLRAENSALKTQIRRLQQGPTVVTAGAHVPSSQIIFKEKSSEEKSSRRGGAVAGHRGNGRARMSAQDADEVVSVAAPQRCNECKGRLEPHSTRHRGVLDVVELRVRKLLYELERRRCSKCRSIHEGRLPLFRGSLYSNALLAQVASMHYLQGIPIGRICEMLGDSVNPGSIFTALHRVAAKMAPMLQTLVEQYRASPVKHADETSWRTDGQPGWSWLFCSPSVSLFECQNTRGARVPARIFGTEQLPGVLVVDRFSSYNKLPCQLQYCYAHLLREVKKLDEEFPDTPEVASFVDSFSQLLGDAMHLQGRSLTDKQYYKEARQIAGQIKALAHLSTHHPGIESIQRIFCKQESRLFQWVLNRDVPAHNNRAERELRQTVIARKVSFGSQSENGAKTRSILMSVLATAKKRLKNISPESWLSATLDSLALDPSIAPSSLLPPQPP